MALDGQWCLVLKYGLMLLDDVFIGSSEVFIRSSEVSQFILRIAWKPLETKFFELNMYELTLEFARHKGSSKLLGLHNS